MAKKIYVGVGGAAHKVKKTYVGVGGVARKVKKAYIGVGGVARCCFSGGEPAYYGTGTALSAARSCLAAASIGNYALFGGGSNGSDSAAVDAYDASLTRTLPTALSFARTYLSAASNSAYAIFAGGVRSDISEGVANADAYNSALTRTAASLQTARGCFAGTSVGDYALFGGGYRSDDNATTRYVNSVDAYDPALTRSNPSGLSYKRSYLAAASTGSHALFAGGWGRPTSDGDETVAFVQAYDSSLTRTAPASLSQSARELAGARAGDSALFAGGWYYPVYGTSAKLSVVNAYDASLTRTSPASMSYAASELAAVSAGGCALFGGGNDAAAYLDTVNVYDASLTRTVCAVLSAGRLDLAAAAVGDYALFAGGKASGGYSPVVDVYAV